MEDTIKERQQRLAALRATAGTGNSINETALPTDQLAKKGEPSLPFLTFETIAKDVKEEENRRKIKTAEEEAEAILQEALNQERDDSVPGMAKPLTIEELAPKKANLDLKMGIQRRMEILEERTQGAILELVRRKVSNSTVNDDGGEGEEENKVRIKDKPGSTPPFK